ncbi:TetR/AcrR family transcriptional regulator [Streptomyces chartreusis]
MEGTAPGRATRSSVWLEGRVLRAGRGRRPSELDRGRIIAVTVQLLDIEGLAKFSMRRLATELNVTAMSVYWYVDTKDDLLELTLDTVFGELRLPEADGGEDWRDQLRGLAAEYRALIARHPWLSALARKYSNTGPNALAFSRGVECIVRGTGLPVHRHTAAIFAVSQFVYGFGPVDGPLGPRRADAGLTHAACPRPAMNELAQAPEAADVVRETVGMMGHIGADMVEELRERDFRFALELVVAGIEALVARG